VSTAKKEKKRINALGRGCAISGNITKLEQSRFSLDVYAILKGKFALNP
jgi:hypothetical protein